MKRQNTAPLTPSCTGKHALETQNSRVFLSLPLGTPSAACTVEHVLQTRDHTKQRSTQTWHREQLEGLLIKGTLCRFCKHAHATDLIDMHSDHKAVLARIENFSIERKKQQTRRTTSEPCSQKSKTPDKETKQSFRNPCWLCGAKVGALT